MAKNTIKIKKYSDVIEERIADAGITPGHLLEWTSTGVKVHATASGIACPPMFALENELEGEGITDAFVATDKVQVWIPGRGDQVYALLANGQNAAIGVFLVSAGDGTLNVLTEGSAGTTEFPEAIVGMALEAVDMSGSSGVDPSGRIEIMII